MTNIFIQQISNSHIRSRLFYLLFLLFLPCSVAYAPPIVKFIPNPRKFKITYGTSKDRNNITSLSIREQQIIRKNAKLRDIEKNLKKAVDNLQSYVDKRYPNGFTSSIYNEKIPRATMIANLTYLAVSKLPLPWTMPQTKRNYVESLTDKCTKASTMIDITKRRLNGAVSRSFKLANVYELNQTFDKVLKVCEKDAKSIRSHLAMPLARTLVATGVVTGGAVAANSSQLQDALSAMTFLRELLYGDIDASGEDLFDFTKIEREIMSLSSLNISADIQSITSEITYGIGSSEGVANQLISKFEGATQFREFVDISLDFTDGVFDFINNPTDNINDITDDYNNQLDDFIEGVEGDYDEDDVLDYFDPVLIK